MPRPVRRDANIRETHRTTRIDHTIYVVASLDEGVEWAADPFGVPAAYEGGHIGLGARNALPPLGSAYGPQPTPASHSSTPSYS